MTGNPNTPERLAGQLSLDGPAGDLDERGARLRAELDALDLQKTAARTEALGDIREAAMRVEQAAGFLDGAVAEARGYGATWQQIADAAGLAKSAAWERWAHRG